MSSLKDKGLKDWLVKELAKIDAERLIKAGAPEDEYSPEADAFLDTLLIPDFEYVQIVSLS